MGVIVPCVLGYLFTYISMRFVSDIVFISIRIKESKRDKNLKLSMHVPTSPLSLSLPSGLQLLVPLH